MVAIHLRVQLIVIFRCACGFVTASHHRTLRDIPRQEWHEKHHLVPFEFELHVVNGNIFTIVAHVKPDLDSTVWWQHRRGSRDHGTILYNTIQRRPHVPRPFLVLIAVTQH